MGKIVLLLSYLEHTSLFQIPGKRIGRQNFAGITISFLLTVCQCKFLSTKKEILLMPHSSKKGHFDAK